MPAQAILVVDNQKKLLRQVAKRLTVAGYRVVSAESLDAIIERAPAERASLVIIHSQQPLESVLESVRLIKKNALCKGMMIMCYSEVCTQSSHIVSALESGVDEYVIYPFNGQVFIARVKALLRRATFQAERSPWLTYKDIRVNPDSHIVQVAQKKIDLTPKEFGLLCHFLEKPGTVLDRSYLMESIWEYSYFGTTRTVDKHVENLRNKLGKAGTYIHTVERVGYKLV